MELPLPYANSDGTSSIRVDILTDNAGDDAHGNAALLVQLRYHKTDIILFPGRAAVIAGVSHSIDPVRKPHIDDAFMYIGDAAGVFALHTATLQGFAAGILGDAFDISVDRHFFL